MINMRSTGCCGMREINDLGHGITPEEAMFAVCELHTGLDFTKPAVDGRSPHDCNVVITTPLLLFSGVTTRVKGDHSSNRPDDYAGAFAAFITDKGLGEVVVTKEVENPSGHNRLKAWLWTPNQAALTTWWRAHAPARAKDEGVTPTLASPPPSPLRNNAYVTYRTYNELRASEQYRVFESMIRTQEAELRANAPLQDFYVPKRKG